MSACSWGLSAFAQTNPEVITDVELESISSVEKVGSKKLKGGHWFTYTEIIIDASPDQVWGVLTDTENYPDRSEIMIEMDGEMVGQIPIRVFFKTGVDAKPNSFITSSFM